MLVARWFAMIVGVLACTTAGQAGGSIAPGLQDLYSGATRRHARIEHADRELRTAPPPGVDHATWSRYVTAERRRLAGLREESQRVLDRYAGYMRPGPRLPLPPPPPFSAPSPSRAAGGSFWSRVKDDIFGRDFDWRRMLAAAGGGGLGFFLGSRFLGPTGGMIGAAAGAFATEAVVRWIIERKQRSGVAGARSPLPHVNTFWPLSPPPPPPPPPHALKPAPAGPVQAWEAMRRDYVGLSGALTTAPGKGTVQAYEQYRQSEGAWKSMQGLPVQLSAPPPTPLFPGAH